MKTLANQGYQNRSVQKAPVVDNKQKTPVQFVLIQFNSAQQKGIINILYEWEHNSQRSEYNEETELKRNHFIC